MQRFLWTIAVGLLAVGFIPAPGRLEGVVLSPGGTPVAGALVQAADMTRPSIGVFPQAYSGTDGHFRIEGFRGGAAPVTFWAGKPDDFYPEMAGDFYTSRPPTVVRTTAEGSATGVKVYLAPQCGRLQGTVTEAGTGNTVVVSVEMWRVGRPNAYFGASGSLWGTFEALVPTVPVVIYIHAQGYMPWFYPGTSSSSKAKPLVIAARQTITLKVTMKKQN